MEFTAQQIADFLGGKIEGDAQVKISSFSKIEDGKPGTLTFLANPKYSEFIYSTKASVVLVNNDFVPEKKIESTLIRVENSYSSLAKLLELADSVINPKRKGIDPLASIAQSAKIGKDVYVGPFAVIDENASIGDGAQIYAHAYVGQNVTIGDGTTLYSNVNIYKNCYVGKNVIIHSEIGRALAPMALALRQTRTGFSRRYLNWATW